MTKAQVLRCAIHDMLLPVTDARWVAARPSAWSMHRNEMLRLASSVVEQRSCCDSAPAWTRRLSGFIHGQSTTRMQYGPSKRSFPVQALVWALIIAASGFLFGRLSVRKVAHEEVDADDGAPMSALKRHVARALTQQNNGWHPVTKDWDDLAEAAGLLDVRPPLVPGETGNKQYVVAPFQVRPEDAPSFAMSCRAAVRSAGKGRGPLCKRV